MREIGLYQKMFAFIGIIFVLFLVVISNSSSLFPVFAEVVMRPKDVPNRAKAEFSLLEKYSWHWCEPSEDGASLFQVRRVIDGRRRMLVLFGAGANCSGQRAFDVSPEYLALLESTQGEDVKVAVFVSLKRLSVDTCPERAPVESLNLVRSATTRIQSFFPVGFGSYVSDDDQVSRPMMLRTAYGQGGCMYGGEGFGIEFFPQEYLKYFSEN